MAVTVQKGFADALLDADRPIPAGIIAETSPSAVRRFAVYRNNVVAGLTEALRERFPVVEKIVGEEFFRAMARIFVAAHPPKSPVLMEYGDELPCFLECFQPAAELPYLGDVARLEAARTRAYHAADGEAVGRERLCRLAAEDLAGLRLALHPSVQVIRSQHPIVTIWAMNAGEVALAPIEDWRAEDALVTRPAQTVLVGRLPPGGAAFVEALQSDATLADAAHDALAATAHFDLTAILAILVGAGLVTGVMKDPPP